MLKTLLDRKLIATAGRKNVVGKPILYKTTRDFLVQFGLKDLSELPTLKEFEELGRLALTDADETPEPPAQAPPPPASEPQPDGADQPLENTAADPASTVDADRPLGEAVAPDIDDKSIPGIPGEPEPDQPEPPIGPPGPPPEPIEEPPAPVIPQQTDPSSEPNA